MVVVTVPTDEKPFDPPVSRPAFPALWRRGVGHM